MTALHLSLFSLMLAIALLYISFIMFRYVLYILDLSKTFNMKEVLDLVTGFLPSNEMITFFPSVCLCGGLH